MKTKTTIQQIADLAKSINFDAKHDAKSDYSVSKEYYQAMATKLQALVNQL